MQGPRSTYGRSSGNVRRQPPPTQGSFGVAPRRPVPVQQQQQQQDTPPQLYDAFVSDLAAPNTVDGFDSADLLRPMQTRSAPPAQAPARQRVPRTPFGVVPPKTPKAAPAPAPAPASAHPTPVLPSYANATSAFDYGAGIAPHPTVKAYKDGQDQWSCVSDTDWYLIKLADRPDNLPTLRELADPNLATDSAVIKLLCRRYEEINDEKTFQSREACAAVDARNKAICLQNNKIVSHVNENVIKPLYHKPLVVPHPPEYEKEAADRWNVYSNKPEIKLAEAIKYLMVSHKKVAELDYKLENAVALCDELAFAEAIKKKIADSKGKISVRISGQRPAKWNGVDETDSRGLHIRWVRLPEFSFLSPQYIDYEYYCKEADPTVVVPEEIDE